METKKIAGVLVTMVAPFENHMANGGEKLFGNASSIKRRPDGRVYVSGQMQRHVLFSAIDRLNHLDKANGTTFVSNGDGITNLIEIDLRADLGGFMHTNKGDYSDRRIAPLSVTPATALDTSSVGRDLLVRIRFDKSSDAKNQALATREYSEQDKMNMNFFLDITSVGVSKSFVYKDGLNLGTKYFKHITDDEKKRRVKLFLEATRIMNDYANQARNAVCGEPEKVLIVFDDRLSRKACRYYTVGEKEQANIIKELDQYQVKYFVGDDASDYSVADAYRDAMNYLDKATLVDLAEGEEIMTFAEAFECKEKEPQGKKSKKGKDKATSAQNLFAEQQNDQ